MTVTKVSASTSTAVQRAMLSIPSRETGAGSVDADSVVSGASRVARSDLTEVAFPAGTTDAAVKLASPVESAVR